MIFTVLFFGCEKNSTSFATTLVESVLKFKEQIDFVQLFCFQIFMTHEN